MPDVHIIYFDDNGEPDPKGLNFRGHLPAELGASSSVVKRAWVRYGAAWGKVTFDGAPGMRVVALDGDGHPLAENDHNLDFWGLPEKTRSFTVEGRRENAGTLVSATLLQEAK